MWIRVCAMIGLLAGFIACATAPRTEGGKRDLEVLAQSTLEGMLARDADLRPLLDKSAGYAVFPSIGKGAAVVGAAYGRGILYENGRMTGYVELNQGSLGAQLGAQTFSELVVFENKIDVDRLKDGQFSLGANVSAVALDRGAAATAEFQDGVAVFTVPRGGLMAEVSVSGQQINYRPGGG